jgi:hypothetical protein
MTPPPFTFHREAVAAEEEMDQAFAAGDFEKAIRLLTVFGLIDREMAFSGCDAVWELAKDELNAASLGNVGACEVLMKVVRAWGTADEEMAWNGCSAISVLARENKANRAKLGAEGACAVVVDLLRTWANTSTDVAFYGCRAVWSLGKDAVNEAELNKLGASFLVLASMESGCRQVCAESEDEL